MKPELDPWQPLRSITQARIALGRSGGSLPTDAQLDFRLAHARARDAVLSPFDEFALSRRLETQGIPAIAVESAAADRAEFLQRPDLGRRLTPTARALLSERAMIAPRPDVVIIVSDGLSTLAANTQAEPLLAALLPMLRRDGWQIAPVVVARHARVALQDEVGEIFRAQIALMLLGERPGLGSADSLGAYFTHSPAVGKTDADRNCISNIRPGGLSSAEAAHKLHHLLSAARRLGLSGVTLKDDAPSLERAKTNGALGT